MSYSPQSKAAQLTSYYKSVVVETSAEKIVPITTTTYTVGNSQAGTTFILSHTSGNSVALPAPSIGFNAKFIVGVTSPAHVLTAPSANIWGSVCQSIVDTRGNLGITNAQTSVLTTVGSVIGDQFVFVSDSSKLYLSGSVVNYNGIKFA